jgi:hypothetical protein
MSMRGFIEFLLINTAIFVGLIVLVLSLLFWITSFVSVWNDNSFVSNRRKRYWLAIVVLLPVIGALWYRLVLCRKK